MTGECFAKCSLGKTDQRKLLIPRLEDYVSILLIIVIILLLVLLLGGIGYSRR